MRGAAERGALDRRAGGSIGSISTTQPKRFGSFGCFVASKRSSCSCQRIDRPSLRRPQRRSCASSVSPAREVEREVLFARQVGAPRRHAAGAVVERAEHQAARRVGRGLHQRVAGGRAADRERRGGGEAARVARRPHHLPAAAVVQLAPRSPTRRARPAPSSPSRRVQVFMPSGCSRPSSVYSWFITSRPRRAAVERVVVQAVVVHAHLHRLLGGAVARRRRCKAGIVAGDADRLAPGARTRAPHSLRARRSASLASAVTALKPSQRAARRRRGRAGAAGQRRAARRADQRAPRPPRSTTRRAGSRHVVDARVGRAVAVLHRVEVLGHRGLRSSCACATAARSRPRAAASSSGAARSGPTSGVEQQRERGEHEDAGHHGVDVERALGLQDQVADAAAPSRGTRRPPRRRRPGRRRCAAS